MTPIATLQLTVYLVVLLALAAPLGGYIARVYDRESKIANRLFGPIERSLLRLAGARADEEMTWARYATGLLLFNAAGLTLVYLVARVQPWLPLNPAGQPAVSPEVAFNTAVSFATNTNWQAYGGETTLSNFTQMFGLTVQNFVSAGTGLAVMAALIRSFKRSDAATIGSFWVDLIRGTVFVLLPLSAAFAVVLVSQGVVQTFDPYVTGKLVDAVTLDGKVIDTQVLALGPAASQIAIKQLGTNGGGFFNVNSAHPFENPTPLSNFLELLAILLIPAAQCFAFGKMLSDGRQGRTLLLAMLAIFIPLTIFAVHMEEAGNPLLVALGVDSLDGNMEGKEVRFSVAESAIWSAATTAASNGSVNAMHDSFTPLGGLVPLFLIQLGEIIFGGVGSGLYGMLAYVIIAVFVAGLMVGRTPEYLGKRIETFEMKMASLVILIPASAVLVGTAIACSTAAGVAPLGNPGIHGFSEILYAFSSAANNNGSAFGGLTASGTFYATATGIAMLLGRYWVIIPILALAGSLANKKILPPSAGTLPTHTPLFIALLVGTIVLVGALTFVPALGLGPVVEHLSVGLLPGRAHE